MGNYLFGYNNTDSTNIEINEIDYENNLNLLDNASKIELMMFINKIKTKKINIDDLEKMKNIELENKKLLPMAIELYHKLLEIYGEYTPAINTKNNFSYATKKLFFIKPKFSIDDVMKINTIEAKENVLSLMTDLVNIAKPDFLMENCEITLDEYNKSFNDAPMKKDMIGISKKILKDMPVYLKMRFINKYNEFLTNYSNQSEDKNNQVVGYAKGFYIYKLAKHGPTTDINSFRQILAVPNIINQLHRILNMRLSNYMIQNKYIDTNIQKGCISGQKYSIFEQIYKVKRVLTNANIYKKSCVVVFLDITNAFGNLNLNKLYDILRLYNVDEWFIDYLSEFYSDLEYCIDIGNATSNPIKWNDGLIQGCSLSPLLFIIAMNYILTHLDQTYKNDYGYDFSTNNKILLTAYVDDVCLICKDLKSAETVFNKFESLCEMLGLTISKSKCAMMIVNDNVENIDSESSFGSIKKVDVFKYLGEHISCSGTSTTFIKAFIKNLIIQLNRIDKNPYDNATKMQLYQKNILPWLQKKSMLMYDIGMTNRLKIVSIIKSYMKKWQIPEDQIPAIFCDIPNILKTSDDEIIKQLLLENPDHDADLEHDLEISNYVVKNNSVSFSYDDVDDGLEIELENYVVCLIFEHI